MNRRAFLSRLALASTGLLVGDAALEAFDRLTHRKVWAGATFAARDQYWRAWDVMVKTRYAPQGYQFVFSDKAARKIMLGEALT